MSFQIKHFNIRPKAKNLFEVLVSSENDGRLQQWIKCFEYLFDADGTEIYDEFYKLRWETLYLLNRKN